MSRAAAELAAAALLMGAAFVCDAHGGAESALSASETWDDVVAWIYQDAALYGVSGAWLEQVAFCESRGDPFAVGRLGEFGPFQFHPWGVWWQTPLGSAGVGPYQASIRDHVTMAVWAFSRGLSHHWSCAR